MNNKISDKDKKDWENFLKNKEKTSNQDILEKKKIEIPNKDKQDWENFLNSKEKIPNKDFDKKRNLRFSINFYFINTLGC